MRARRSFSSRPKRPTLWSGGYLIPGQTFSATAYPGVPAVYRAQMTFPFTGFATADRPTMIDAVLQRVNLDLSISSAVTGGAGDAMIVAIGVVVVSVADTGVMVATDPVPNPLYNGDADWVIQAFLPGQFQATAGLDILRWAPNFGGPGIRLESKAKRRLRDTDILALCLTAQTQTNALSYEVDGGWRALFKGR